MSISRIILGNSIVIHVTPLFHKLHWLPVFFQVQFKILVITLLKFFIALVHATWGTVSPQWDWATPLVPAKGACYRPHTDPISQEILASEVQEKSHFCHDSHPLKQHSPPSRWDPYQKGLKTWLCQLDWNPNGGMSS